MGQFKKGDVVTITDPTDDQRKRSKWRSDTMDRTIGKIGVITNQSLDGIRWAVKVDGESAKWHYCEDVLKPATKWKVKKAKKRGLLGAETL